MKEKIKILNLYSGIGGNRKLWDNVEVTAVERVCKIAQIYSEFFPADDIVVADAHKYLLEHIDDDWDFIWSSPPCPTHSHIRKEIAVEAKKQNKPVYPDLKLYEEILFLKGYAKCKWVVENVVSWYHPMIRPFECGSHYFWSNFPISEFKIHSYRGHHGKLKELYDVKGFDLSNYSGIDKRTIIRNCVKPELGLHVFNCAFKTRQSELI